MNAFLYEFILFCFTTFIIVLALKWFLLSTFEAMKILTGVADDIDSPSLLLVLVGTNNSN